MANVLTENRVMNKGGAIRLSSIKAAPLIDQGFLADQYVGLDLLDKYESRVRIIVNKLGYSVEDARKEAIELVNSCLKRHEAMKKAVQPSGEFLTEVDEFNRLSSGNNPISKIDSDKGAGEWAGYRCNIGDGCHHGCIYCWAEGMKVTRFGQVENAESWLNEVVKSYSTKKCRRYDEPIMFPTTHDISPTYLPAYRCHLYNILSAGNNVVLVSKPHRECIEAICSEFSSFRDTMIFRFSIGGLNDEVMRHWEPGAPALAERLECLKYTFEQGYKTSVSAEPMLCDRTEAEKLYYTVEPYVTEDIWFGKMKYIGKLTKDPVPDVSDMANAIRDQQTDDAMLSLVEALCGLPKVEWKDSITKIMKHNDPTTN
jgi:DNA repair photolyase